ncbi:MAG: hypothetical protein OIN66_11635 [Candidatus Methanoperedens sp.]|nr:hypothetical protein [Candidatus Methanoperedens sp.]
METIQVAEATVNKALVSAVKLQNIELVEIIEQQALCEVADICTEDEIEVVARYHGFDAALELKNDETLADPFECILHGMHPRVMGKLWFFSVKVREELMA